MSLTAADKNFFDSIAVDYAYISVGKNRLLRNRSLGFYNQIKDFLKKRYRDKYEKFEEYLKERYHCIDKELPDRLIENWEEFLTRSIRPNIYAELFRIKRNSSTKIEIYALVDNNVLEFVCINSPTMYRNIMNYCEFWDKAQEFCILHGTENPADLDTSFVKEEFRIAMRDKLIPEIDEIKTIANDREAYALAYYDLSCGNADNPTPAWDNFLAQMANESTQDCFKAWIYGVFNAEDFGRQILWLHGVGETGKSVIGNTIYRKLESLNKSIVTTLEHTFNMDKFSGATYVDKRFAMCADTTDMTLLRNTLVKNLTGNDVISSRSMGVAKEEAKVFLKVLVTSNRRPFVNEDRPEEVSRLMLISLVSEKCKEAYRSWHDNNKGNWQKMLYEEIDDFIAKCAISYKKCVLPNSHKIMPYEGFEDEISNTIYHLRRDLRIWWDTCIEPTGEKRDKLKLREMAEDYERFLAGTFLRPIKLSHKIRSFMLTFMREMKIDIKNTKNFNVLYINGYKFIEPALELRVRATQIIDDQVEKDIQL